MRYVEWVTHCGPQAPSHRGPSKELWGVGLRIALLESHEAETFMHGLPPPLFKGGFRALTSPEAKEFWLHLTKPLGTARPCSFLRELFAYLGIPLQCLRSAACQQLSSCAKVKVDLGQQDVGWGWGISSLCFKWDYFIYYSRFPDKEDICICQCPYQAQGYRSSKQYSPFSMELTL